MLDVSKLAAKHIQYLQDQLTDLKTNQEKMEKELDVTCNNISDTADDICKIIRQREGMLLQEVKET